jgi:hypothetical protein
MRRIALLLASLALAFSETPVPAQTSQPAADWQALANPGDFVTFWWDRASLVHDGDVVRAVVRARAHVISPSGGYADLLTEIRCADRMSRVVRTTNYGRKGEPIAENHPKATFHKIETPFEEALRAAVC